MTVGVPQLINVWELTSPRGAWVIHEVLAAHDGAPDVPPEFSARIILQYLTDPRDDHDDEDYLADLVLTALSMQSWEIAALISDRRTPPSKLQPITFRRPGQHE